MRNKPGRRRAIILIVALFTIVSVVALAGAAFTLMPTGLFAARQTGSSLQALLAATSGLEYAQTRLQQNPAWRGDSNDQVAVSTPGLKVIEDRGVVIGILTRDDGARSAFRMRFNYQNGPGGGGPDDHFSADPSASHQTSTTYLCCNNLQGSTGVATYRDVHVTGSSTASPQGVARGTVLLQVEGYSGDGLREATDDNLNQLLTARFANISSQVIESHLQVAGQSRVDAGVAAAGTFTVNTTSSLGLLASDPQGVPNARSLDKIKVEHGAVNTTTRGRVTVPTTADFVGTGNSGTDPLKVVEEAVSTQKSRWLKLGWSQVPQAVPTDANIKAGTYVWRLDPSTNTRQLHYYPQDFATYADLPDATTNPGALVTSEAAMSNQPDAIHLDPANLELRIKDKVYVKPEGSATGLSLLVGPGVVTTTSKRPTLYMDSPDDNGSGSAADALLTMKGNLNVDGKVDGYGGLTSEGSIKLQGASALEASPDDMVALYAKGDINLNQIDSDYVTAVLGPLVTGGGGYGSGMGLPGGHHPMGMNHSPNGSQGPNMENPFPSVEPRDMIFAGVLYTMGNFKVNAPDTDFYLRGVLTAFGGDPEGNAGPGSVPGSGNIGLQAKSAVIVYDPSYLQGVLDASKAVRLDRISWNVL